MKKILSVSFLLATFVVLTGCQKPADNIYNNTVAPIPVATVSETAPATTLTPKLSTVETLANTEPVIIQEEAMDEFVFDTNDTTETEIQNYVFNSCGTRWQFKEEPWYLGFIETLTTEPALSNLEAAKLVGEENSLYSTPQEAITDYGNLSEKNVAYICKTAGNEIALVMLNGSTDTTGGVLKYNINTEKISFAEISPYQNMHFHAFMARAGNIIPLKAGYRDNFCTHTFKVDYNFVTNQAVPVRKCTTCQDGQEACESLIQ